MDMPTRMCPRGADPAPRADDRKQPVKIAHVTDFYLPRLGGIEMQVAELTGRERAAGHEVHVITSSPAAKDGPGDGSSGGAGQYLEVDHLAAGRCLQAVQPDGVGQRLDPQERRHLPGPGALGAAEARIEDQRIGEREARPRRARRRLSLRE